jgi:serine/threonine protein kinase
MPMEAQPVTHPPADVLEAFGLGKLDDASAEAVGSHLDLCADCRKEVAALSGDSFLARLRQAHAPNATPAPAKPLSPPTRVWQSPVLPPASQAPIWGLPPELAGNPQYEVLRELGRGGMGVVYLARNKLMDRLEVLKVVTKALLDRPGAVERFLREIRSAAKLSHANVVTAYSALQQGELLAFAMEYVEGEDLAQLVKARGPLPVANACYYVQQAALGLQHAFEKGMVHRDVKPQNLILAREGKKHVVKVLDFGLAKATREGGEDSALTGTGQMLGTPDYIAPEQTVDAANADIRADVYSLGCTLYFLLTGSPPFKGKNLYEILQAHHSMDARPLNQMRSEVPADLAAVVGKMMAKEPADRYQTPAEVVQALTPFVKAGQKKPPTKPPDLPESGKTAVPVAKETSPVAWETLTESRTTSTESRKRDVIRQRRLPTAESAARKKWLTVVGGVGVLLLGLAGLWAAGVFKVKTKDGTIVLENVPEGAEVQVEGATVTLTRKGDVVMVTALPEGPHRLKVVQGGKEIWSSDVTVKLGGDPVRLKTEPRGQAPPPPVPPAGDKGWVLLFNGKDTTGWKTHPKQPGNWRVVKGTNGDVLTGSGPAASYLYTERADYKDFHLRVEARINDGGNSGVFFRTAFGPQIPANNPRFPLGYEAQINSTHGDVNKTGSLYVGSEGALVSIRETPVPPEKWFMMEVIVEGNRIIVKVNGKTTADYPDEKRSFTSGHIALQQHNPQTVAEFRKIEVMELPSAKPGSTDPFQPNSVWVNTERTMTLTVMERKGERFVARFVIGPRIDREVTGTVKDGKLSWLAKDVRAIKGEAGGDNFGTITSDEIADSINFVWRSDKGGSGTFTLRRRTDK